MTEKPIVLVVDDSPENISVLSGVLRDDYKVKVALNGVKAIQIAESEPDLMMILLDVMMPEMDGYEVCERLKSNPVTANIPIIFVTAKERDIDEKFGFSLGAVDYITKPVSPSIVRTRVRAHIAVFEQSRLLDQKVRERTAELERTRMQIVHCLGRAAEFRDNQLGLHVYRISHYSRLIAQVISPDDHDWVELVYHASPLYDVGKLGIPDSVLLKPGELIEQDWQVMRQHPAIGAEIIGEQDSDLMLLAKEIALTHHERWDGSGYPNGLKGEDIPLAGRVVAVADVFDDLTCQRPYKQAWSVEETVDYICDESGKHFDPQVVAAFLLVLDDILAIHEKYKDPIH
ncbi:chemotaxis protein CheY [Vibrio galatheae]|uniref:Chemotaxis protein CheY n=1 Tax=Vibrio galatheae TaxID=579748 RepID=A0A0F4NMY8_9VIBR|nr:HD domain-containing phosphohydrolase [Vibrio galatheae]KJY84213.1 chemotaxis protein CheY [Vibrio galatheae]